MSKQRKWIPDFTVTSRVRILSEIQDYNHTLLNIPEIWTETRGGGIKIAVLDTGVPNHTDIKPANQWSGIPDYEEDLNGHGTHCAGVLAATAGNGIGVAGLAPDADMYYGAVLDAYGSGSIEAINAGIRWATDQGVDVISMSLGASAAAEHFPDMEAACNYAADQGVILVAAAGNEGGDVGQPAQYDSVIAVAAVNSAKDHASFSNSGPELDFAAGGVNVYSTYLRNSYARLSGTSMACPALAGVVALILAKHRLPEYGAKRLTLDETREHLRKICYDVGAAGFDELYGHGIPIFGYDPETGPIEDPTPEPEPEQPDSCKLIRRALSKYVTNLDAAEGDSNAAMAKTAKEMEALLAHV